MYNLYVPFVPVDNVSLDFIKRNTMDDTSGAGIVYSSGAPEFIVSFYWISCCVVFRFLCNVLKITVCPYVLFL